MKGCRDFGRYTATPFGSPHTHTFKILTYKVLSTWPDKYGYEIKGSTPVSDSDSYSVARIFSRAF